MKMVLHYLITLFFVLGLTTMAQAEEPYLAALDDIYWQDSMGTMPKPQAKIEKPMIAIIIDDLGVDRRHSIMAAEKLPAKVTLSYLAYAGQIQEQVQAAQRRGHEIMLHLPMEPDRETADAGPHHLAIEMTKEQIQKNLTANLDGFTGYTGVNNHMGSKFSRYALGLDIVMAEIKKRGLFFVDSRTAPDSIIEKTAQKHNIATTHRDVFLDHVETSAFTAEALKRTEMIARHSGSAIAIGHPKDITVQALEAWIPTLEAKGFQLVTVSDILKYRNADRTDIIIATRLKPEEGRYLLEKIDTPHP
jgi:hypothetical protein